MQWTARALRTVGARARTRRRGGQALVEYGLILSVVSIGAIGALVSLGMSVQGLFVANAAAIQAALNGR